jgi:hypothetical protein
MYSMSLAAMSLATSCVLVKTKTLVDMLIAMQIERTSIDVITMAANTSIKVKPFSSRTIKVL